MSITIDFHALQTLPPSLINRDDTGAPKTAIFGGVPRQRVSSQAWKRAIRKDFGEKFPTGYVGYRTRRAIELLANSIQELDPSIEEVEATALSEKVFKAVGFKLVKRKTTKKNAKEAEQKNDLEYAVFLSVRQIKNLAEFAVTHREEEKFTKKALTPLFDQDHSVDIAMFGRMVADAKDFNVDASVQVAHAIGVHESEPEFDFYTTVDDMVEADEEAGAAMMGTIQMMSSTLYRFASLDVDSLAENLGDQGVLAEAIKAFTKSFITSLPTGKQNSFAHNSVPELVYVTVRGDRSISLVNAFEEPVVSENNQGRRKSAADRLAREAEQIQNTYGFVPQAAFVMSLGDLADAFIEMDLAKKTTLPELVEAVAEAATQER
ncbi:type I-E CRISPR-associated protein Cas7/Cse4/CasC [uncultured Corynebacterium sp.]|uniref:type I-E CRISPR-associated protein Cas7/Cse4/CasC n=1 Tax=uncultured Corynebacterium sp. TaxID=159447 RepID=UPI00260086D9|nr:type I-E CRISPR-associated protein Cas7/Cse4/CasC [uncultured Corynebacterium sp.]